MHGGYKTDARRHHVHAGPRCARTAHFIGKSLGAVALGAAAEQTRDERTTTRRRLKSSLPETFGRPMTHPTPKNHWFRLE